MALHSHRDDTQPNAPTRLMDDTLTVLPNAARHHMRRQGLHPLALLLSICAGIIMWAGIFSLIHTIFG